VFRFLVVADGAGPQLPAYTDTRDPEQDNWSVFQFDGAGF
jgi:hypothetical protein